MLGDRVVGGLAHIVQQEYNRGFRPWYGAVDVAMPVQEANALWGQEITIRLEDGRCGRAKVAKYEYHAVHVADGDKVPGQSTVLYIVGWTSLSVPS